MYQGRSHGPNWAALAGLCGALATLLAITGVLMWLRKRRNTAAVRRDATAFPDRRLISAENA
ncbi:LPXTG cell wall anchor domain-containing protein [Methylobacterium sp. 391_Methyba4]|uniref:LPXTG cell wall anchor domain-containing protein n=1 Tax=Methylobacterium sp. 391_Methyba4 TaxID=3038924 RepID=UPI00241C9CCE|nr:LPXTG cell wall anchor domain-containing protein [Methylobacterium sp. 391_Methyba4]WFS09639.1 LPXTG cell wall anchor domain-containing protein [Methylobacterium sp. 391_Methyba4]